MYIYLEIHNYVTRPSKRRPRNLQDIDAQQNKRTFRHAGDWSILFDTQTNREKPSYLRESIDSHFVTLSAPAKTAVNLVKRHSLNSDDLTLRNSTSRMDIESAEDADTRRGVRSRRAALRRDIFSTAEPTDNHAVCIFPFRRYEVCGMILYAKSSLELIVNNRIGKVGIRPDGRPPSAHPITAGSTPWFTPFSPAHPFAGPPPTRLPSPSLPPHLI